MHIIIGILTIKNLPVSWRQARPLSSLWRRMNRWTEVSDVEVSLTIHFCDIPASWKAMIFPRISGGMAFPILLKFQIFEVFYLKWLLQRIGCCG